MFSDITIDMGYFCYYFKRNTWLNKYECLDFVLFKGPYYVGVWVNFFTARGSSTINNLTVTFTENTCMCPLSCPQKGRVTQVGTGGLYQFAGLRTLRLLGTITCTSIIISLTRLCIHVHIINMWLYKCHLK